MTDYTRAFDAWHLIDDRPAQTRSVANRMACQILAIRAAKARAAVCRPLHYYATLTAGRLRRLLDSYAFEASLPQASTIELAALHERILQMVESRQAVHEAAHTLRGIAAETRQPK